jgi:antitoxin YefM
VAITASEARKNLFPLIEKVNDDRTPIEITSRRGDAVLLSREDYEALEETAHLLRVPANAKSTTWPSEACLYPPRLGGLHLLAGG